MTQPIQRPRRWMSPTAFFSEDSSPSRLLVLPVAALLVMRVVEAHRMLSGYDMRVYYAGAKAFLSGANPYANATFVTPPSGLLVLAPFRALPVGAAVWAMQAVSAGALVVAMYILIRRFFDTNEETAFVASMLVVLSAAPTFTSIGFGSLNALIMLSFALGISASLDGDERRSGLWMGVGLALKPVLAPLWLAYVIQRRWKASLWAIVPVAAGSVVAVAVNQKLVHFIDEGLPHIVKLDRQFIRFDVSVSALVRTAKLPSGFATLGRAGALALTLLVAFALWRGFRGRATDVAERTEQWVVLGSALLLGTLLASQFSWRYYSVFLLPLFVLAAGPGRAVRNALVWFGAVMLLAPDSLGVAADPWLPRGLSVARQTVALGAGAARSGAGRGPRQRPPNTRLGRDRLGAPQRRARRRHAWTLGRDLGHGDRERGDPETHHTEQQRIHAGLERVVAFVLLAQEVRGLGLKLHGAVNRGDFGLIDFRVRREKDRHRHQLAAAVQSQ